MSYRLSLIAIAISVLCSASAAQRLFERQSHRELPARQKISTSVFHGDVNGDGREDIVIGSEWSHGEDPRGGVWLNTGQGRFESVYDLRGYEMLYGLADLDGDGDLDILGSDFVHRNDGAGVFTTQKHVGLTRGSGASYRMQTVIADLDGNGLPDACVGAELYFDFQSPTPRYMLLPNTSQSFADVAVGDLDGDGDQDLVFALKDSPSITRLFFNDGMGTFTEVTGTQMPTTRAVIADVVKVVDLDLDGDLDILVGGKQHGYFQNDGKGKFSDGTALVGSLDNCTSLDVGDIDGDGFLDIVAGGVGTGVIRVHFKGQWLSGGLWPHGDRTTNGLALLDVDGDQDLDLVQVCGNAMRARPSHVEDHLLMNDGHGRFFDTSQRYLSSDPQGIALGDMNGDGWVDVVGGAGRTVLLGDSQAAFAKRVQSSMPSFVQGRPALGDLDNDGDLDVVFDASTEGRFQIATNDGTGRLSLLSGYLAHPGVQRSSLIVVDLDQDGDLDIFISTGENIPFSPVGAPDSIWHNDGTGKFSRVAVLPFGHTAASTGVAADLDGDGDIDLANGTGVYWCQPSGSYTRTNAANNHFVPSQALARDLDGDGLVDLIFVDPGSFNGCQGHSLFWNQGGGQFTQAVAGFGRTKGALGSIAAGDIDEDGDSDLVVGFLDESCRYSSAIRAENGVYRNLGGRLFEDKYLGTGSRQYPMSLERTRQVFLVDLDGDGDLDFYAHNDSVDKAPRSKVFVNVHRHLLAPFHSSVGRDFELELHGGMKGGSIFVAFGEASVSIAGLGRFGLDPNTVLHVASLAAPTMGRVAKWKIRIPAIPAAVGTQLYWQAIAVDRKATLTNVLAETLHGW